MVEWNIGAANKAAAVTCVPDSIGGLTQLQDMISSCPRPYVLVSEREISVLRRGLTKDGWKRSLYLEPAEGHRRVYTGAGLLSAANRFLDADVAIPERSGHYHHFFCDCGSRLTIPEDLQIAPEYVCPECGARRSGDLCDGAIRYLQHQQLAAAALALAMVYGIEKERVYADKVAEILTRYAEAYPGPHTDAVTGGMLYQSLCEAVWAIPLAQSYDLIYYSRSLTDEQREKVEQNLFMPVAEGLRNMGTHGNWGSWHLSAVGVIGFAIKNASLVEYALRSFKAQISEQLGGDGLWPESVHTYHFYPLAAFVHLAEACCRAGIDIYNWEVRPGKSLKLMFTAPLQYMYPSFRLPAINDGWYDAFLPVELYEIAHRRWNDPAFAWALKRAYRFGEVPANSDHRDYAKYFSRNSFYAFLFGRDLPGRSGPPVLKSHDFGTLGVCTLRNGDDLMATLDYGPCLGHGHLDKLSFTLYANETVLIPDYGTPGYGSKMVDWYRSTPAHNTVVVDGRSQEPAREYGLMALYRGAFLQFAEAQGEDHYPGVTHSRRVLLLGDACLVSDELTSDEEHYYDWFIRCEGEPKLTGGEGSREIDGPSYPLVEVHSRRRVEEAFRLDWQCEKGSLACGVWTHSTPTDVMLGTCPAETANRSASALICRQHGQSARFLSLLMPSITGGVQIQKQGCTITIADQGLADHIYVRGSGEDEANAMLQTDGEVAAVRTKDGAITCIALVRGTWVKWMQEPLLECPAVVNCVEICFRERSPQIRYCCDTAGTMKLKTNARAMRINGHRTAATTSDGHALLRVTPQMLAEPADNRP